MIAVLDQDRATLTGFQNNAASYAGMRNAASIWRPTACVQVMKPGTCPVHRIMSDGRQRGRGKELRHTAAVSFAKWADMICFIRSDTEVRGALPAPGICSPRLCWSWPATRALLRSLCGPCSAGVIRGARLPGAFFMCMFPPTLLPACLLAAGPCSPGSCFRCLASIRCSTRRVPAGRDPSPRPYQLCDPIFSALLAWEAGHCRCLRP